MVTRCGGINHCINYPGWWYSSFAEKGKCRHFKGRGDKQLDGKCDGKWSRVLTMTQGKWGFEWLTPECFVGSCYFSIKKHKYYRSGWMRLKSSDTGAGGQTAYRLHVWFILQGEKNTLLLFFRSIKRYFHTYLILSCLWLPLLSLSISISLHFKSVLLYACVLGLFLCVHMHTLWGEGDQLY